MKGDIETSWERQGPGLRFSRAIGLGIGTHVYLCFFLASAGWVNLVKSFAYFLP